MNATHCHAMMIVCDELPGMAKLHNEYIIQNFLLCNQQDSSPTASLSLIRVDNPCGFYVISASKRDARPSQTAYIWISKER